MEQGSCVLFLAAGVSLLAQSHSVQYSSQLQQLLVRQTCNNIIQLESSFTEGILIINSYRRGRRRRRGGGSSRGEEGETTSMYLIERGGRGGRWKGGRIFACC
jgi:hypothetical protein